jgi:hypothetical protein
MPPPTGPSILILIAAFAVGMVIAGVVGAPLLMLASKMVLRKAVPFGQSFLIVCACVLTAGVISWPVQAGIGDIPEGRTIAQVMGWAISFGVMTALVDKATTAGLTRSATVAALNFVLYLVIWFVVTLTLMGAIMAFLSATSKSAVPFIQ